jgi:large subunit ribosomal protein L21
MKYAVIKTGGKQYKVSEGDVLEVERLPLEAEKTLTFPDVLLYTADGVVKFGQPVVEGVTVEGKILANIRGEKIRVSKYKAKVRYRRVHGHRQELSQVRIESIFEGAKPKAAKVEKKETAPVEKVAATTKKAEAKSSKPAAKTTRKPAAKNKS